MFRYNKTTQCAVAALSRLAELYGEERTLVSSADVARSRNLPKPLVAKLLTVLSQAGLVTGTPGPGGGYMIARHPSRITLHDVAVLFERPDTSGLCPFGPSWCQHKEPCPLHQPLQAIYQSMLDLLKNTTFEAFMIGSNGARPDSPAASFQLAE